MSHKGPIQQWTEVCLSCGNNQWDTDICEQGAGDRVRALQEQKTAARKAWLAKAELEFEEYWKKHGDI